MCQMVNSDMEKFKECKEDREGWVEGTFLNRLIDLHAGITQEFQKILMPVCHPPEIVI